MFSERYTKGKLKLTVSDTNKVETKVEFVFYSKRRILKSYDPKQSRILFLCPRSHRIFRNSQIFNRSYLQSYFLTSKTHLRESSTKSTQDQAKSIPIFPRRSKTEVFFRSSLKNQSNVYFPEFQISISRKYPSSKIPNVTQNPKQYTVPGQGLDSGNP
jgi:hypothetical protein